jgi:hypothetical protein
MTLYHFIETDSLVYTTSIAYIAHPILYCRQRSVSYLLPVVYPKYLQSRYFQCLFAGGEDSPLLLDSGSINIVRISVVG